MGLRGQGIAVLHADAQVAVWHRWADNANLGNEAQSDDNGKHVLVFVNAQETMQQRYSFSGAPVDGVWRVQFNGDRRYYSSQYQGGCESQEEIEITGGKGEVCLPGASLLVLSTSQKI